MEQQRTVTPRAVWQEYESGRRFKSGLGELGMYEQNRRNERFFVGDQWHGAKCGGERPLVRHNVIKRIGDYKMAVVGATPLSVVYSAEGIPHAAQTRENKRRESIHSMMSLNKATDAVDIDRMMSALSNYFKVTAERVKFSDKRAQVLEDAYIGGTGYLHTYWDADVQTGLYADANRQMPIRGDIGVETLDVENVYMGDPMSTDIQSQPYILIAQRKSVRELQQTARRNGVHRVMTESIVPDNEHGFMAGDRASHEPIDSQKATVITRLWKTTDEHGRVTVKAIQVCKETVIRDEWDLGIRLYPLAAFTWQKRKNCAYGDSEITNLIPNQIAINRMLTASVWAVMMMGIPMTVVNGDVVTQEVSNDPGQVLRVYGSAEDVETAVRYVNPPEFSPKFDENIQSLISNTLAQSGANEAALGDIRPDNASAIIAVREAATLPMQTIQNRYCSFVEDVARIWAEFWIMKYGCRCLKMEDESGIWYMPFDGARYQSLLICATIEVGSAALWSESQTVSTLDSLLKSQVITPLQYLKRLPTGVVPNVQELIREMQQDGEEVIDTEEEPTCEYYRQLTALSPAQQKSLVKRVTGGA